MSTMREAFAAVKLVASDIDTPLVKRVVRSMERHDKRVTRRKQFRRKGTVSKVRQ